MAYTLQKQRTLHLPFRDTGVLALVTPFLILPLRDLCVLSEAGGEKIAVKCYEFGFHGYDGSHLPV